MPEEVEADENAASRRGGAPRGAMQQLSHQDDDTAVVADLAAQTGERKRLDVTILPLVVPVRNTTVSRSPELPR